MWTVDATGGYTTPGKRSFEFLCVSKRHMTARFRQRQFRRAGQGSQIYVVYFILFCWAGWLVSLESSKSKKPKRQYHDINRPQA